MRVKFRKLMQRRFLKKVMDKINCPSLRELSFRLDVSYSSLKNYYNEDLFLSRGLFEDLCYLGKVDLDENNVEFLEDNWGQVKGGKKGTIRNI
jgi:hypothetical protein